MTYGYITEECPCGAKLKLPALSTSHTEVWGRAIRLLEAWRTGHKHEIQPQPEYGEPPTVVESMSHHERAADEFFVEGRAPIGFVRNEVR